MRLNTASPTFSAAEIESSRPRFAMKCLITRERGCVAGLHARDLSATHGAIPEAGPRNRVDRGWGPRDRSITREGENPFSSLGCRRAPGYWVTCGYWLIRATSNRRKPHAPCMLRDRVTELMINIELKVGITRAAPL